MVAATLLFLPTPGSSGRAVAGQALVNSTYAELDRVRDEKLGQLRQYLDRVRGLAAAAAADPTLGDFLRLKARWRELGRTQAPPPEAAAAMSRLEASIGERYLERYLAFHDILFVAPDGVVVHSVRAEPDKGADLFAGPWRDTALSRRLRADPGAAFIDYEHYEASGEPSAFFVEPVVSGGAPSGWLILQCTIGKLNRIFDRGDYLGRTGEVFLVNRERLMLTDSRFQAETSILRQHLSAENISAKFAERRGHKTITDYRGQRALTSFEVVPVLGREWLLVAKIDEDEVVTRAWRRAGLEAELLRIASSCRPSTVAAPAVPRECVRVDMDEFHAARPGDILQTWGVSTCTAVVISWPGRFAYLGHLSAYDRAYGAGDIDVVEQMLKRIRQFEVYPSEMRRLRAVIVAPHVGSARGIIDRLLEAGLFLSQVTFVSDPGARWGDVVHDPGSGETWVRWKGAGAGDHWVAATKATDLGSLADTLLGVSAAARGADSTPSAAAALSPGASATSLQ